MGLFCNSATVSDVLEMKTKQKMRLRWDEYWKCKSRAPKMKLMCFAICIELTHRWALQYKRDCWIDFSRMFFCRFQINLRKSRSTTASTVSDKTNQSKSGCASRRSWSRKQVQRVDLQLWKSIKRMRGISEKLVFVPYQHNIVKLLFLSWNCCLESFFQR